MPGTRPHTEGVRRAVIVSFPAPGPAQGHYNGRTMRPQLAPAPRPTGPFRLGEWDVRPDHNKLVRGEEERHLEPKAMDLLVFLRQAAPEVVSKETLVDSVWEGRIISEGTLTNTVAELRRALDDDARNPRYIETIPKRGYRLVAAVAPSSGGGEDTAQRHGRPRTAWFAAGAVVALALVATAAVVWIRGPSATLEPDLVLVAPFVNRTGDPDLDPVALLARDRLVAVISASGLARAVPASAEVVDDGVEPLTALASERRAGLAVGGTLYLSQGRVEVQAKVVSTDESALLFAVPAVITERGATSAALERVAQKAAGAIATHLRAHGHFRMLSHVPVFEAYQEFIAGTEVFAADPPRAVAHLERAVRLDPAFTSAHFRLGAAYLNLGRHDDAARLLARLEDRRPELTEFERLWLDYFSSWVDGRRADGLVSLRQIEARVPDDPVVQMLILNSAVALNRPREARAAIFGMRSAPGFEHLLHNPVVIGTLVSAADAHHVLGEYDHALAVARLGLEVYPADQRLGNCVLRSLACLGDVEALEAELDRNRATGTDLDHADGLVEAASSSRAHGQAELAADLAARAVGLLENMPLASDSLRHTQLLARALVLEGSLDRAHEVLAGGVGTAQGLAAADLYGWLGVVAARRGDVATARRAEAALTAMDSRAMQGWPSHYLAGIDAWMGDRERALNLIDRSRAEGWGAFRVFHDAHRPLFEPLEGEPRYRAVLHPDG